MHAEAHERGACEYSQSKEPPRSSLATSQLPNLAPREPPGSAAFDLLASLSPKVTILICADYGHPSVGQCLVWQFSWQFSEKSSILGGLKTRPRKPASKRSTTSIKAPSPMPRKTSMPNTRSLGYRMRWSGALKDDPLIACPQHKRRQQSKPVPHRPKCRPYTLSDVNLESINVSRRTKLNHVERLGRVFLIT